jgi:hypothetical protein
MAHWDGHQWQDHEIAYAGTRLYQGEDDYTGLACIDPNDCGTVYVSSDVDIHDGRPNTSGHYEIYRGRTEDLGRSWTWMAVTSDSEVDNLRPIVPRSDGRHSVLLWLRGTYTAYTDYDLDVVGLVDDVDAFEDQKENDRDAP